MLICLSTSKQQVRVVMTNLYALALPLTFLLLALAPGVVEGVDEHGKVGRIGENQNAANKEKILNGMDIRIVAPMEVKVGNQEWVWAITFLVYSAVVGEVALIIGVIGYGIYVATGGKAAADDEAESKKLFLKEKAKYEWYKKQKMAGEMQQMPGGNVNMMNMNAYGAMGKGGPQPPQPNFYNINEHLSQDQGYDNYAAAYPANPSAAEAQQYPVGEEAGGLAAIYKSNVQEPGTRTTKQQTVALRASAANAAPPGAGGGESAAVLQGFAPAAASSTSRATNAMAGKKSVGQAGTTAGDATGATPAQKKSNIMQFYDDSHILNNYVAGRRGPSALVASDTEEDQGFSTSGGEEMV
ncbi:unnamed protein product [Amoebophrya sp. A120]|nr:unnamed protein product [Amoebophrya sp. A120]|eukprot:GSA120T00014526001.1